MDKFNAHWHTSLQEIKIFLCKNKVSSNKNPFYDWEWLFELENSNSVGKNSGWQPFHLSLWREEEIIAIAPLYIKSHSYGEFIFDNAFHNLSQDLGLDYYPKLIGMSPLSPVEGYRFLISQNEDELKITTIIMEIIDQFATKNNILSCNFLYVDSEWAKIAEKADCAKWLNKHSVWFAEGKETFSDYLSSFNSNQRRNIKKERNSIAKKGLEISSFTGNQINKELMEEMYYFYELHCSKWGPWGSKYLSQTFFENLADSKYKDNLVLFSAHYKNSKSPLAMSMCVYNDDTLWGRYWGSKKEIDYLHFELCYYSPISWALEQGIKKFDPGAGGNHKLRRGFQLKANISLYRWYDKKMDYLIKSWLPKANELIIEEIQAINCDLPFKQEVTSL